MSIFPLQGSYSPGLRIATGEMVGHSLVHKFGRNSAVGTSYVPLCNSGIFRTPQPAAATALRVKAGNAADTADGAGARSVTVQGINQAGALVTETLATAGASASAATSATFIRLLRFFVASSGTYASQSAGSHVGDIVIENAAGTENWASILVTGFARGQSQIGCYTVPLGYQAYLTGIDVSSESNKLINLNFYTRSGILAASAPYQAMQLKTEFVGFEGQSSVSFDFPKGPYDALTDMIFMGKVGSGTADISIDFRMVLVKT